MSFLNITINGSGAAATLATIQSANSGVTGSIITGSALAALQANYTSFTPVGVTSALVLTGGVDGISFNGITNIDSIDGYANSITVSNCTIGMFGGYNGFSGSNNSILNNTVTRGLIRFCQYLSDNNTISGNVLANAFFPETIVYDSINGSTCLCTGTITAKTTNTLTVSTLYGSMSGSSGPQGSQAFYGRSNVVGFYALISSGAARGRYYKITAQSGNVITVDTSIFSVDGSISTGSDKVTIHMGFINNQISNNTYTVSGDGGTGIALFGSCIGNQIYSNNGIGGYDFGVVLDTDSGSPTNAVCSLSQYTNQDDCEADPDNPGVWTGWQGWSNPNYAINAANNWHDNNFISGSFLGQTVFYHTDATYADGYAKPSSAPLQLLGMGLVFDRNNLAATSVVLNDVLDVEYTGTVAPVTTYWREWTGAASTVSYVSGSPQLLVTGLTGDASVGTSTVSAGSLFGIVIPAGLSSTSAFSSAVISLLVSISSDPMQGTSVSSSGSLVGVALPDSLSEISSLDQGLIQSLVAISADGLSSSSTVSVAQVKGLLICDSNTFIEHLSSSTLINTLSGSGSIRSPGGEYIILRRGDGQPLTIYRCVNGTWQ